MLKCNLKCNSMDALLLSWIIITSFYHIIYKSLIKKKPQCPKLNLNIFFLIENWNCFYFPNSGPPTMKIYTFEIVLILRIPRRRIPPFVLVLYGIKSSHSYWYFIIFVINPIFQQRCLLLLWYISTGKNVRK